VEISLDGVRNEVGSVSSEKGFSSTHSSSILSLHEMILFLGPYWRRRSLSAALPRGSTGFLGGISYAAVSLIMLGFAALHSV
jgi:hypothetical protein